MFAPLDGISQQSYSIKFIDSFSCTLCKHFKRLLNSFAFSCIDQSIVFWVIRIIVSYYQLIWHLLVVYLTSFSIRHKIILLEKWFVARHLVYGGTVVV